jgi:hypothetical protein
MGNMKERFKAVSEASGAEIKSIVKEHGARR